MNYDSFIEIESKYHIPMAYRETAHTRAKKATTRQRLLHAATTLVREGGFAAASAAAVAHKSGIATGSIYRHFPNKSELVAEVFRFATEHEIEAVVQAGAQHKSAKDKLTAVITTFCERAFDSNQLAYALIAEPVDPRVELERLRYRHAWAEMYQEIIEQGVKEGSFAQQDSSLSSAALVGALGESMVGPLGIAYNAKKHDEHSRDALTLSGSLASKDQKQLVHSVVEFALRAVGFTTND